ncbi:uncharacterized protein [Nicotiana sylvestris]|uniref:uncharacterized protein n=1 Tax=Nicotiana sylvestris TaxID=4096 RepID=UPI00388C8258
MPIEQLSKTRNILSKTRKTGWELATILSKRVPETLPADTERNPKEIVNVVTLRSGQVLKDPTAIQKDVIPIKESGEQLKNDVDKKNKGLIKVEKNKKGETSRREEHDESKHMPALPLPQKQYREKLDKSAFINASLCQILEGDPGKEEEDRGDLSGVSINLMPLSIYRKLEKEIGEIRSTPISLQLVDQTTLIPEGILKYVLVRVDKFVFPLDFIVVNMEENKKVPLILGRPFLATGRAILDIQ